MSLPRMHPDEVPTDPGLAHRLVSAQFPDWAELAVERVATDGTDNALYRLGTDKLVRLPRIWWAVDDVEREQRWLPRLAPHLPCAVPEPLALGEPGESYPWRWSIYRWLAGANPVVGQMSDPRGLATDVARFVTALHAIQPTDGPPATRGVPLAERDAPTRRAIQELDGRIDTVAATAAWERALRVPAWNGPPVWIHGDLAPGNLLTVDGRLAAVIDFGGVGIGDPAADMIVAWNLLPADARAVFREQVAVDEATWLRGRGWALSVALIQLPYYWTTNPELAANGRYALAEVLADIAGR